MTRIIAILILAGLALTSCMSAADREAAHEWVEECHTAGFTPTQCGFLATHFVAGSVGIGR